MSKMPKNLNDLMDKAIEMATEMLFEKGDFPPAAFLLAPRGVAIVPLPSEHQEIWSAAIRKVVELEKVTAVAIIGEAWFSLLSTNERLKVRPSEDPKKKECIFVYGVATKERNVRVFDLERKGEAGIILNEEKEIAAAFPGLRFAELDSIFGLPVAPMTS